MDIHWTASTKDFHAHENTLHLPKRIELYFWDRKVVLSKGTLQRCVDFLREDFQSTWEIYIHSLYSDDMRLWFHIFVHPESKTIFIPPWALNTDKDRFPGWGSLLQMILEKMAARNWYRLIVCISADRTGNFSDRVIWVLRQQGYYLTYPIWDNESRLYGIHQSSHHWDWIPELNIPSNELAPPTISYQ